MFDFNCDGHYISAESKSAAADKFAARFGRRPFDIGTWTLTDVL